MRINRSSKIYSSTNSITNVRNLILFVLFNFSILISEVNSTDYYQMIWYESLASYATVTVSGVQQDYHSIKMKISQSNTIFDTLPTYIALTKRSNSADSTDISLYTDDNAEKYVAYTFFLLNFKGNHIKNRKYVMWNVACASGIVSYKIKFFTCDTNLDAFYTDVSANNKVKNYGNTLDVSNISVTSGFASSQALYNALTTDACLP